MLSLRDHQKPKKTGVRRRRDTKVKVSTSEFDDIFGGDSFYKNWFQREVFFGKQCHYCSQDLVDSTLVWMAYEYRGAPCLYRYNLIDILELYLSNHLIIIDASIVKPVLIGYDLSMKHRLGCCNVLRSACGFPIPRLSTLYQTMSKSSNL